MGNTEGRPVPANCENTDSQNNVQVSDDQQKDQLTNDEKIFNIVIDSMKEKTHQYKTKEVLTKFVQGMDDDSDKEKITEILSKLYEDIGDYNNWRNMPEIDFLKYISSGSNIATPPSFFAYDTMKEDLNWLKKKTGCSEDLPENIVSPDDVMQLMKFIAESMKIVGATGIKGYIKTTNLKEEAKRMKKSEKKVEFMIRDINRKNGYMSGTSRRKLYNKNILKPRKTCRAQLILKNGSINQTFKDVKKDGYFSYLPDYQRAIKIVSKLMGRFNKFFHPYVTRHANRIGRVGFVDDLIENQKEFLYINPITTVVISLMVSNYTIYGDTKKEKVSESPREHYDSNNKFHDLLPDMIDTVQKYEPDGIDLIAQITSDQRVLDHVLPDTLEVILQKWSSWMDLFRIFLQEQWKQGVYKCTRRNMRVLPSMKNRYSYYYSSKKKMKGIPVNTAGWNQVAKAWNYGTKCIKNIEDNLGKKNVSYIKIPKLVLNRKLTYEKNCLGEDSYYKVDKEVMQKQIDQRNEDNKEFLQKMKQGKLNFVY